jgi:hypothetical protein
MALTGGNIGFTGYQQPNYAGAVEAAGLPMQAIGQAVGQAADYFKQQGEKKKLIKQSDIQIDAALKLFPDLAPTLQGVRDQIKDENVSLNERADIAESVAGLINMGTKQMQANAEFGLRKRQLDIEEGQGIQAALMKQAELEAKANEPIKLKPRTITLGPDSAADVLGDDYGNIYDPQSKLRIVDFNGYVAGKPLEETTMSDDTNGLPPFSQYGNDIPTDTGEVLPNLVPQSSAGQQAEVGAGGAAYPDGVAVAGTPLAGVTTPIATERTTSQSVAELAGPTYTPIPQPRDPGAIQRAADISGGAPTSGLTPRSRKVNREPLVRVNTGDDPQQQRATAIDKSLLETKAGAAQVASQLSKIEEISKLLDEGVNTGFAQNVLMQGKRIFGQDVSDQEAFKAASGNVALGFINLTKGAISDREMQYFTEVLAPSIGTSVEGNKKIVEFLRKAADKAAKVEGIISNGMRSGKSAFDIDEEVQKFRNTEAIGPKEVGGMNEIYSKHGVQ